MANFMVADCDVENFGTSPLEMGKISGTFYGQV